MLIPAFPCTIPSYQADERYRKNIQGSPQTAAPPKQPPLPPRSSEPFSNGGSSSEAPAMHRPMEPQVTPSSPPLSFPLPPAVALCWICVLTRFWGSRAVNCCSFYMETFCEIESHLQ